MNAEIFAALRQLEKERGIPVDYMVEKITQALVAAYKKDRDGYTDNVYVELTEDAMRMYAQKEVVDEVITPATEVTLDAARKVDPHAQSWATWWMWRSPPRRLGGLRPRRPSRSSFRASARPSAA